MPALWQHPGVTNKQRESLVQEVFNKISIDGDALVTVEPKPEYAPLFAEMLTHTLNGYREFDSPPSPPVNQRAQVLNLSPFLIELNNVPCQHKTRSLSPQLT
jgi:hypothetical protein